MRKLLLLVLAISIPCFASTKTGSIKHPIPKHLQPLIDKHVQRSPLNYSKITYSSLAEIRKMLYHHSDTLSINAINTVLTTISCSKDPFIHYNNKLTIIDYSLPSNKKRLWIFDLKKKKLLFYTYVSHGIRSGTLDTIYFSNKYNSKASSLGVYYTEQSYYGRHGFSMRLKGLDIGFNHNANGRSIVMHGAWYVNKDFINKYGRIGRSWGCPAVPNNLVKPIVKAIRDKTLFVVYYPSKNWLLKSIFFKCKKLTNSAQAQHFIITPDTEAKDNRGAILYADRNNSNKREESDPILVVSVENYKQLFNKPIPLQRMLRRKINNTEYIALNHHELTILDVNKDNLINNNDNNALPMLDFVVAYVFKRRGYWATEFKEVNLGQIKEIQLDGKVVLSEKPDINLNQSDYFIRWLGL